MGENTGSFRMEDGGRNTLLLTVKNAQGETTIRVSGENALRIAGNLTRKAKRVISKKEKDVTIKHI